MKRLHALGIRTSLITGDNEQAAQHFARAAGIDDIHARVLPAEKAHMIRKLQESARVAMVGDGINDAPALMQAEVGIAFGSGADIATESADVIILNQRLAAVLDAYEVSRYSYRKMVQNVSLAFLFNGIGIPAAATGLVHPIWGMVAMATSVTSIFINSLWGKGAYFFDAIKTVGHAPPVTPPAMPQPALATRPQKGTNHVQVHHAGSYRQSGNHLTGLRAAHRAHAQSSAGSRAGPRQGQQPARRGSVRRTETGCKHN